MKDLLEDIENFGVEVIMGRRRGARAAALRVVLFWLSKLYGRIVSLRLLLFRERFIHDHHLGVPVISVGNLTVGGTGKTPVVELLAKALRDRGRRVAILSRGYKSKRQRKPPLALRLAASLGLARKPRKPRPRVVADFDRVRITDAWLSGDEPLMLAMNCKGVAVVVDRDRVHGGSYAIRELGADVLLLDDGFQYLRLKHRHDIVLVDRTAPWGTGHMLPRGTLREPPRNLKRASHIFLTKCEDLDDGIIEQLRKHNRVANIIECRHRPVHLQNVHTGEIIPLSELRGKFVGAMSGIAVPQSFENLLRRLGAKVDVYQRFTDHHRFNQREVHQFVERCVRRDVGFIVTTEKDFVRLPPLPVPDVPFCFLRVEIEILRGHDLLEKMTDIIANPRRFAEA